MVKTDGGLLIGFRRDGEVFLLVPQTPDEEPRGKLERK